MSVSADHHLQPAVAAEIIGSQFPDVQPRVVSYLGEGYDSTAFDVDDRWVFRFPKREDVEQQLLLEIRLLPVLAVRSPLPLPAFSRLGRPTTTFPRHFGGYPKLRGAPANTVAAGVTPFSEWGPILGRFLSWLHAYPADEVSELGVPVQHARELLEEIRSDAIGDFDNIARVAPSAPLAEWHRFILEAEGVTAEPSMPASLVHADLSAEHVLCDMTSRAITGVIDWSDVSIGDPAIDLAGLYHWGGQAFVDIALRHYGHAMDAATLSRARYFAACRGVGDVTFGLLMHRPEYVEAGIAALMLCVPDANSV